MVAAALKAAQGNFPSSPRVVDFKFHRGEDSTGDAAVWIYVVLDDTTPASAKHFVRTQPIAEAIRTEIRKPVHLGGGTYMLDLVPYVYFVTQSELQAVKAGES